MQDLNQLIKIIAERKGMTLDEATQKVNQLTKGKTLFGAKLAINHFLETKTSNPGETTLKGYHETPNHERIKE
jgi:hypothetical protein